MLGAHEQLMRDYFNAIENKIDRATSSQGETAKHLENRLRYTNAMLSPGRAFTVGNTLDYVSAKHVVFGEPPPAGYVADEEERVEMIRVGAKKAIPHTGNPGS